MIMLETACYSRKRLKNYLSGKASEPDSDAIEQHVGRCTTCEHLLDELQSTDDSLERCLRIATPADQSQPPEWVRQLAAAPPPAADDPGADDAAEAVALQCLRSIDRYELLRTIGRGGMSIVYAARHRELQCDVALKILRPGIQADRAAQERFQREMQILGQLSHPAIVRATDAGRQDATRYLVMELVDGVDLSRLVRLVGPPSVAECCAMVAAAAEGLACAHAAGVIHRDIKPSNLLLAASGQIKIVDFGLARLGSTLDALTVQTTVGRLLGTLDYMAPEQVDGAADASSVDIYSLGATLYKLLTGRPPHGHSSEAPLLEYLRRIGANEIAPLSRYRADSSKALGDFVAELLQRDPAQRPHDAQHVAQRLQEFSAGADLKSLAREAISVRRDINAAAASADASPPSEAFFSSAGLTHESPLAESKSQLQSTGSGGRISFTTLVAGLSALGLLAICGVLIVLQTNVGTLRIESEVDDVRVELVDEENAVQGVLVDQGEQETTLRAGRYRVRLAGSSDRLELKPDVVVLRRGKTAVAAVTVTEDEPRSAGTAGPPREWPIRRESETASGEDSIAGKLSELEAELEKTRRTLGPEHPTVQELQAEIRVLSRQTPPQAIPTEPVYEGRTLPQWLAILQYEQKPQARIEAAGAVRLLIPAVPPVAGFQAMFQAMLQMIGQRHPHVADPVMHWNRVLDRSLNPKPENQRERRLPKDSDEHWNVFGEALQRLPAGEQASMLATLVRSEDEEESKLAIVAVAINAQELLQNPQIDIVDEALASVADDASSENVSLAQLARASLLPDPGAAAEILVSMNPSTQSNAILRLWWNLVRVRDLPVDRMERLKWAGHVLVAAPEMAEDVLFRNTARLFPEANWRDPGPERLNQLEAVLSPVIAEARARLEASAQETNLPRSKLSQLDQLVSILAKAARTIPVQRDPELAAEIVEILQQRLEQLVAFREAGLGDVSVSIPTVLADLTSSLLLQTGGLPNSIPELEARELLDIVLEQRVGIARSSGSGYRVYGSDWYPFAAILAVQQRMNKTWTGDRHNLLIKSLDPVIIAALLADAHGLDAKQRSDLVRQLTMMNGGDELKRLIELHPTFRSLIERWHERAANPESKAMANRILEPEVEEAAAEGDEGSE